VGSHSFTYYLFQPRLQKQLVIRHVTAAFT